MRVTTIVCSSLLNKSGLFSRLGFLGSRNFSSTGALNASVEQTNIQVKDVQINYGKIGQGDQHLLFLPGIFGTVETDFEPIMNKLDHDKFTAICWDPPGYGKSRPPEREIVYKNDGNPFINDADYAAEFMKILGIPKYSVVGWSYGGITGAVLTSKNKDAVDKFICFGSRSQFDQRAAAMLNFMKDKKNWKPDRWKILVDTYGEAGTRKLIDQCYRFADKCAKTGCFKLEPMLKSITAPTLILYGKEDLQVKEDHPRAYAKLIPNSKLEMWTKGGHDLHLQYQSKFLERIQKFLLSGE